MDHGAKRSNLIITNSCSICLVEMDSSDEVCEINDCKHIFHTECLHQWLEQKNECPLCKGNIDCYKMRMHEGNAGMAVLLHQLLQMHEPMQQYFAEMHEI